MRERHNHENRPSHLLWRRSAQKTHSCDHRDHRQKQHRIASHQTKTFSTFRSDLTRFRTWLSDHGCFHVCMESTGRYWIPAFNISEEKGFNAILTHSKYVKAIKGKKTDKRDSKWIADLFKHDIVRSSFIPPKDIRALRDLARYRFKLVAVRTSEKNRYQDCMTISDISLASVLSDPFGKTSMGITEYLLSSSPFDEKHCKTLIKGSAKKKTDEIIESVRAIAQLPGLTSLSAVLILAETGADMSVFESSKHLVSWAGLAPANNESAGKKKSVRITKAGRYLKPLPPSAAFESMSCAPEQYHKFVVPALCLTAMNLTHRVPHLNEDCFDDSRSRRYTLSNPTQPTSDRRLARRSLDVADRRVLGIHDHTLDFVRAVMFARQQKTRKQCVSFRAFRCLLPCN
jgi:transposase